MGYVKVLKGDATRPVGEENKIICHICNDVGAWGAGFVLALSRRWLKPEKEYRKWHSGREDLPFVLGNVQLVQVEEDIWVANMVAQHDLRPRDGVPPIRYDALETCLQKAAEFARDEEAGLHMPKIGAGLAGGDWGRIKSIIDTVARTTGVSVTIYEF